MESGSPNGTPASNKRRRDEDEDEESTSESESDDNSSDDGIQPKAASNVDEGAPTANPVDDSTRFEAVLTPGTSQFVANQGSAKQWGGPDGQPTFTARSTEAHLGTDKKQKIPMSETDSDDFDGFGTGLVLRKALGSVAVAIARAVLTQNHPPTPMATQKRSDTDTDDTEGISEEAEDGSNNATMETLRAVCLARGGDPDKVETMDDTKLRNEVGPIPRGVVEEIEDNSLFSVCAMYPATPENAFLEDGTTATIVWPQLNLVRTSTHHHKTSTTTFFGNQIVAPRGCLYEPNPRCCEQEAKLEIRACWHGEETLIISIQGGKATLRDDETNELICTVDDVDMSFARASAYKEADVRALQLKYSEDQCYNLVDLTVVGAAAKPQDETTVAAALAAILNPQLLAINDKYCEQQPELRACDTVNNLWRSKEQQLEAFVVQGVEILGARITSLPYSASTWTPLANAYLATSVGSKLVPKQVEVMKKNDKGENVKTLSKDRELRLEVGRGALEDLCLATSGDGSPALKSKVSRLFKWQQKLAERLLPQVRSVSDDRSFDSATRVSFANTVLDLTTGCVQPREAWHMITRLIRHNVEAVPSQPVPLLGGQPCEDAEVDKAIDDFCKTLPDPTATKEVLQLLRTTLPLPGTPEAFLNVLWVAATGTPHASKAVFLVAAKLADGTFAAGAGKSALIALFESCLTKGYVGVANAGTFSKPIDGERHNTLHTLVGFPAVIVDEVGKTARIDPSALAALLPAGKPKPLPCRMMQTDTFYRKLDLVIAMFASNFEVGADTTDGGGMRRSLWLLLASIFLDYKSYTEYKEAFLNAMEAALNSDTTTEEVCTHVKEVFDKGFHPSRSAMGESLFNGCAEMGVKAIVFQDRREATRAALESGGYVFKEDKTLDKASSPLEADEDKIQQLGRALLHIVLAYGVHNLKDHDQSDPWMPPPESSVAIKQALYAAKKAKRALHTSAHATPEEQKQARQANIDERLWMLFVKAHDWDPSAGTSKHTVLRALHTWLRRADPELARELELSDAEKCRLAPIKTALRHAYVWAKEQERLGDGEAIGWPEERLGDGEAIGWPGTNVNLVFNTGKTRHKVEGCAKEHADVLFGWSPKATRDGYDQQSLLPQS